MEIEYDPAKDAANVAKHGISLARAVELVALVIVDDPRYLEPRVRIYGWIEDVPYCVAATRRNGKVRIISLRRAHAKEFRRHVR